MTYSSPSCDLLLLFACAEAAEAAPFSSSSSASASLFLGEGRLLLSGDAKSGLFSSSSSSSFFICRAMSKGEGAGERGTAVSRKVPRSVC